MNYDLEDIKWCDQLENNEKSQNFKAYICSKGKSKRTKSRKKRGKK